MPDPTIKPLSISVSKPEAELLHDAIATWLADAIVRSRPDQPIDRRFKAMTELGNKLGMNL